MKLRHRSVRIAALAFALSVALPEAGAADRHEAAAAAATGRLTGMVVIGSHLSTRRMQFSLYPDLSRAAVPAATEAPNELANVVVYFEPAAALSIPAGVPSAPRTMRQEKIFEKIREDRVVIHDQNSLGATGFDVIVSMSGWSGLSARIKWNLWKWTYHSR